ncbi:MAG: sodium:solute symporter family protein [Oscillospiraceae bacterium]|nr:sodium:solute symporter family protein [Oscillospiraceae bacterium]
MDNLFTLLIVLIYAALMVTIGIVTSKRTRSVDDFVFGGNKIGPWMTAFGFGTAYFSAVVFIGYAGQFGWSYGISAALIGVGNAVVGATLAWAVLGKRTRLMTKHLEAKTMPDFFEKRYGSKALKTAAALIVFLFLIPYTASVYNGLSRLFAMAFNVQSDHAYEIMIICMALLSAVYVVLGGYSATAINDFIQGIIMLIGISCVVGCIINYQGGLSEAIDKLAAISDKSVPQGSLASLLGPDPLNLLGVVLLTSLGTWGLPQMVHKFYAIRNEKDITRGMVISTVFCLIVSGGCYLIGGFGRLYCTLNPDGDGNKAIIKILTNGKPEFDAIVPSMLEVALPSLLIGLVVVLVLSASLSTLSALVLTSSTTMAHDLIRPACKGKLSDKNEFTIMRVLIAVFLLISVLVALNKNASISALMSYSWGALSGSFLGPFIWGLYGKRTTKAAVWVSFGIGITLTLSHMVIFSFFPQQCSEIVKWAASLPLNLASPINAGAVLMLLSIIVTPIVSLFTKPCDQKTVDNAFSALKQS